MELLDGGRRSRLELFSEHRAELVVELDASARSGAGRALCRARAPYTTLLTLVWQSARKAATVASLSGEAERYDRAVNPATS